MSEPNQPVRTRLIIAVAVAVVVAAVVVDPVAAAVAQ